MSGVISGAIAGMGGVVAPTLVGATYYTSASDRNINTTGLMFTMNIGTNNGASGETISYTATGGSLTYEWQYLTWYGFNYSCANGPVAASGITMYNSSGPVDAISGTTSGTLTINAAYGYQSGPSSNRGIDGYWRLKVSNAAGTIYSKWTEIRKRWDYYEYNCNCTCNCPPYDCNCQCNCEYCCTGCCNYCCVGCCDENNENCQCDCGYYCDCSCNCGNNCNCTGCCDQCCDCGETCDTCSAYSYESVGDWNNWCI